MYHAFKETCLLPSLAELRILKRIDLPFNSSAPPFYSTCSSRSASLNMTCINCLFFIDHPLSGSTHRYPTTPPHNDIATPSLSRSSTLSPIYPVSPSQILGVNNMYKEDEERYRHKMHYAMLEMDRPLDFVPEGRFLDLG